MWFRERRAITNNLAKLLEMAHSTTVKLVEWMQWDAAIVRYALRNGGDADLSFPGDELRLLLAEQLASALMANENLMLLQGKKHLFNIRPIYVPISPDDFEECVAKVWAHVWPDCRYPRYDRLTPEQRFICFGPDGEKRFGPAPDSSVGERG
jgi:hypothetical protein